MPCRLATILALAVVLMGCSTVDPARAVVFVDGVRSGSCATHPTTGPGPFLQCPVAVDLAANKLGVLPGTPIAIEFHLGVLCPPNARCLASTDQGTVVFWFEAIDPVMVRITLDGAAGFQAQSPESLPQWLVEQGPAGPPAP